MRSAAAGAAMSGHDVQHDSARALSDAERAAEDLVRVSNSVLDRIAAAMKATYPQHTPCVLRCRVRVHDPTCLMTYLRFRTARFACFLSFPCDNAGAAREDAQLDGRRRSRRRGHDYARAAKARGTVAYGATHSRTAAQSCAFLQGAFQPCRAVLSAAMLCDSVGTVGALARDASLIVHRLCDCRLGKYAWYTDRALARRDTSDDEAHRRYDP